MSKLFEEYPSKDDLLSCIADENDPASVNYRRTLTYPTVKKARLILNVTLPLCCAAGLAFLLWALTGNVVPTVLIPIGALALYCLIRLSSILIFLVECYQLLAPEKVRMKCRFEPSCSDYMIAAIRKYGAFRGTVRGLKRMRRCKYPNGGYDEP